MTAVDEELRTMIRHEAATVVPPEGARDRGWARLAETLAAGDGVTEPSAPLPAPRPTWLRIVPLTTLIVGVLATVGLRAVRDDEIGEPATIATAEDPAPAVAPLPLTIPLASPRPPALPLQPPLSAPSTAQRRPNLARPPAADDDAFAAELKLLAAAQAAIRRGDLRAGLAGLRRHAELYPAGQFAQDRDALRAIARCESRHADAAAAGRRFLAANPTSIHADRVRDSCGL